MAFDWMDSNGASASRGPKAMVAASVKEQASLLKRLGYDVKTTTKRCIDNVHWQYDNQTAPLKDTEIKKMVASVFS